MPSRSTSSHGRSSPRSSSPHRGNGSPRRSPGSANGSTKHGGGDGGGRHSSHPSSPLKYNSRTYDSRSRGRAQSIEYEDQPFFERLAQKVDAIGMSFFGQLGLKVALSPYLTLVLSTICIGIGMVGFLNYTEEARTEKLWIPQDSTAITHKNYVESTFAQGSSNTIFLLSPTRGGNALNPEMIRAAWELHDRVLAIETLALPNNFGFDGMYNFINSCKRSGPFCEKSSILDVFQYDRALTDSLDTEAKLLAYVNEPSQFPTFATGAPLVFSQITGCVKRNKITGRITSVGDLRFIFRLQSQRVTDSSNELRDYVVEAFELQVPRDVYRTPLLPLNTQGQKRELLHTFTRTNQYRSYRSQVENDVLLVGISYMLLLAYVMSRFWSYHRVHSHMLLATSGVISVALSILSSFGVASALGAFWGPAHGVLPFVLLGIGIDDMFIITQAFFQQQKAMPSSPLEEQVSVAMSHAGMSIFITSVTDCLAFGIGSSSALPSLSSFCIFAALGIFIDFTMQCTFFVACMVLAARRRDQKRLDCLFCVTVSRGQGEVPVQQETFRELMRDYYGPAIANNKFVQTSIIVVFVAFFGVSCYAATQLEQEFSLRVFSPPGSPLDRYYGRLDQCYDGGSENLPVDVVIPTLRGEEPKNKYSSSQVQEAVGALTSVMRASPLLTENVVASWIVAYDLWLTTAVGTAVGDVPNIVAEPATEGAYLQQVYAFINNDPVGVRYLTDIVWFDFEDPTAGILASRLQVYYRADVIQTSSQQVTAMQDLRTAVSLAGGLTLRAFPFTDSFLFWEQYVVIREELFRNLILSLVAVMIVCVILLASPLAAFLVFICISMTIIDLLGGMWFWDVPIDGVSVISAVLAIGLSVDHVAHVGHAFMKESGTRAERIILALMTVGGGVVNGGMSTLLAVIVLAFSESYVFLTIFKQFFCIVLLGLGHGVVFLPVILSLVGPKPYAQAHDSIDAEGAPVIPPQKGMYDTSVYKDRYAQQMANSSVRGWRWSMERRPSEIKRIVAAREKRKLAKENAKGAWGVAAAVSSVALVPLNFMRNLWYGAAAPPTPIDDRELSDIDSQGSDVSYHAESDIIREQEEQYSNSGRDDNGDGSDVSGSQYSHSRSGSHSGNDSRNGDSRGSYSGSYSGSRSGDDSRSWSGSQRSYDGESEDL
jgi:predicted RND superfamily exporter protein